MLKYFLRILVIGVLFGPVNSYAGDGVGLVEIEHVGTVNGKDLVFFYTTTHTPKPACNTFRSRWLIDISTSIGKAQYSLLLAAQASGKEVRIYGADVCDKYAGTETATLVGYTVDYATHP